MSQYLESVSERNTFLESLLNALSYKVKHNKKTSPFEANITEPN